MGFLKRFEVGYTRALNSDGSTPGLSPLFNGGFNIFHGNANLLRENAGNHNFIPAISLGFEAFTNARGVLYHSAKIDPGVRYPPYAKHTFERKVQL